MANAMSIGLVAVGREEPDRLPYRPNQTFLYKRTPEGDLDIHLHFPFDWQPEDQRPAIVFFFGGAWRSGTVEQFTRQATYLASRGMVAARADYRVRERHGVTPDCCVEDAKSAVRWLRMHASVLGIDPERIVAAGGSAGGHLALCTALVEDLDSPLETRDISSVPNALVLFNPVLRTHDWERVAQHMPEAEVARRISPILHLKKGAPPMILFFGTDDPLGAPLGAFQKKAQELGIRVDVSMAEGQEHAFFNKPPWWKRTLNEADQFLASLGYLEGTPTFEAP